MAHFGVSGSLRHSFALVSSLTISAVSPPPFTVVYDDLLLAVAWTTLARVSTLTRVASRYSTYIAGF